MPDYQEVIFTFNDKKGAPLGKLKLRAAYTGPLQGDVSVGGISCKNVPKLNSPTDIFPIEYCTLDPLRGLSKIMLLEETRYDIIFETNPGRTITDFLPDEIFSQNLFNVKPHTRIGILNFGSYVGRTYLSVEIDGIKSLPIPIEIRSKKIGYAGEYAEMMADLCEDCSALIYDLKSPVHQTFEVSDIERKTLYEDFLFMEYLFKEGNLPAAYSRIKESPKTQLIHEKEIIPIALVQTMEVEDLMDIVSLPQYLDKVKNPPQKWPRAMRNYVPLEVCETRSVETLDIPENRFVKFFLEQVYELILKLQETYKLGDYIKDRLQYFHEEVVCFLNDEWLKEIGPLTSIPMNSQTLQKKEGYRSIYYYYLNFEFAFQFKWEDLEDNLKASEKRMSQLYEYWCFFRLKDALKNVASLVTNENDLVELSEDGWLIRLRQGRKSRLNFVLFVESGNDRSFELYYNRGFSKRGKPESRSYSLPFRPDFTIVYNALDKQRPTYIHFDAKYRSDKELKDFSFDEVEKDIQLDQEDLSDKENEQVSKIKEQETSRKFKNADIYKMHTYKDAIMHSLGSYVLYPGDKYGVFQVYEDYEVPSIGALPLKPGGNFKAFFSKVEAIVKGLIDSS